MVNDADGVIYVKLTVKIVNYAVNRRYSRLLFTVPFLNDAVCAQHWLHQCRALCLYSRGCTQDSVDAIDVTPKPLHGRQINTVYPHGEFELGYDTYMLFVHCFSFTGCGVCEPRRARPPLGFGLVRVRVSLGFNPKP